MDKTEEILENLLDTMKDYREDYKESIEMCKQELDVSVTRNQLIALRHKIDEVNKWIDIVEATIEDYKHSKGLGDK